MFQLIREELAADVDASRVLPEDLSVSDGKHMRVAVAYVDEEHAGGRDRFIVSEQTAMRDQSGR